MFITDVDLFELAIDQGIDIVDESAIGDNESSTTTWWSRRSTACRSMLVSYWDAGYIKLDVTDPANPSNIGDSDFGRGPTDEPADRRRRGRGRRATRHQGEFSHDNKFVLAADEDFDTDRSSAGSTRRGRRRRVQRRRARPRRQNVPSVRQINAQRAMVGDTRYVGNACDRRRTSRRPRRT